MTRLVNRVRSFRGNSLEIKFLHDRARRDRCEIRVLSLSGHIKRQLRGHSLLLRYDNTRVLCLAQYSSIVACRGLLTLKDRCQVIFDATLLAELKSAANVVLASAAVQVV